MPRQLKSGRYWTNKEEQWLRLYYFRLDLETCSKVLKRTKAAIKVRVLKMKLNKRAYNLLLRKHGIRNGPVL